MKAAPPRPASLMLRALHMLPHAWRMSFFRRLEAASASRQSRRRLPAAERAQRSANTPALRCRNLADDAEERSLWLFVSTIGEVNAIEPFTRRLLAELGQPPLTLITDRDTYDAAYRARYPHAHLARLDGSHAQVCALVASRPPRMLVVAEIPGILHDAPCRFSYATVHAARAAGAPVVLVNGWLYGGISPSRLDRIEHTLFARDYLAAFNLLLVQTEGVRNRLVAAGAEPARVVVTGNIKFDAMRDARTAPSGALAQALRKRGQQTSAPLIVAGSVTETTDQAALLQAFLALRTAWPDALMVLAPRHPENAERMAALTGLLCESGLPWLLRSKHNPHDAVLTGVLVLDTMGELRGCYSAATIAYVGTDHNILEPLAFQKPVIVSGNWNPLYPSYPVFAQLLELNMIRYFDKLPPDVFCATVSEASLGQVPDQPVAVKSGLPASALIEATTRSMDALQTLISDIGRRNGPAICTDKTDAIQC